MTTYVNFSPNSNASPPFTFQPTLDGVQYTVNVTWNAFGERYYIGISDASGNLILTRAIAGSGVLIQGTLSWSNGIATASLTAPHNVPIGAVANAQVSGTELDYDGAWQMLAVDPVTFTYVLPDDPMQYGVLGNIGQDVDLVAGYFDSTLIFRHSTQQFEVNP